MLYLTIKNLTSFFLERTQKNPCEKIQKVHNVAFSNTDSCP